MFIDEVSRPYPESPAARDAAATADAAAATDRAVAVPDRRLLVRSWVEAVASLRLLIVGIPWVLLRAWNLSFLSPNQDVKHYFDAATGMVAGKIPYLDFPSEYPPGALPFFALPRLFTDNFDTYGRYFAGEMLVVDVAILWLLDRLSQQLRTPNATSTRGPDGVHGETLRQYDLAVAQSLYVWLVGSLGYLAFERYDLLFAAMLLATVDQAVRPGRLVWASLLLGISIPVKLVSVVHVPLLVAFAVCAARAHAASRDGKQSPSGTTALPSRRDEFSTVLKTGGMVVAAALAIFAPFWLRAGGKLGAFWAYHRDRGLQIESTYSSLMLVWHQLSGWGAATFGGTGFGFATRFAYGATEAAGPLTDTFARQVAPAASAALLCGLSWTLYDRLAAAPREIDRATWLLRGMTALTLAFLATNKVFSPQYMLWCAPLVAACMLTDVRGIRHAVFGFVLATVLTGLVLFFYYINLLRLEPMGGALLLLRNLLVLGCALAFAGVGLSGALGAPLRRINAWLGTLEQHPVLLGAAFTAVLAWVLLANLSETTANDIWIQLRSGEDIVRTGTLPYTEVYSATVAGRPFIAHEWLCGVLFYLSTLVFGDAGLSVLTAAVAVGIFLAMYFTFQRSVRQSFWYLPLLTYLTYLVAFRLLARPHIFTILAQALLIMAIERWRREGGLQKLWWLLPMQVVWINLHGAALFGPALMGMLAGYVLLSVWWPPLQMAEPRRFSMQDAKVTIGMTVALAACCLVNPYTWRIVAFSIDLMGNEYAKNRVWEWTTPFMRMNMYYYWLWIWLVGVFGLWASLLLRLRTGPVLDAAYAVLATYLGVRANRFMPDFALLAFPVVARSLYALSSEGLVPSVRRRWPWFELGTAALLLCNCAVYGYAHSTREHRPLPGFGYGGDMPYNEVALLQKLGIKGTIYNEYSDGSLIINRLWPAIRPVLDSRIDLYPLDLVNDYDTAYTNPQAFAQYLKKRNVNVVMLYRNRAHPGVLQYLDSQPATWRRLLDANNRVLYVTRESLRRGARG